MSAFRKILAISLTAAGTLAAPAHLLGAQSLLDRPDNLSADWVGNTGTIYFNFVHRFSSSPSPERKVTNFPTFLVATGIASRALVGFNYATNSTLVSRYPNEWELFARYAPLQQEEGAAIDLGGQLDYNVSVRGVDGELSVARRAGPVRLIAVGRLLADTVQGGKRRAAFGGGGTIRVNRFIALAGDAATLTSRGPGERVAWSAGLHIALPNTPHTLSLHASNANTATLQGVSRGGDIRRYGFEFTVPVTLRRFFSNPADQATPAVTSAPAAVADSVAAAPPPSPTVPPSPAPSKQAPADTVAARAAAAAAPAQAPAAPRRDTVTSPTPRAPSRAAAAPQNVNARIKGSAFIPGRVETTAGSTVTWKNLDQMVHNVAAVDKSFTSPIIGTEGTYSHTFSKPGTYPVYCTIHPFMKATIVVK